METIGRKDPTLWYFDTYVVIWCSNILTQSSLILIIKEKTDLDL